MRKILLGFFILLMTSVSANAQTRQRTVSANATKLDVAALTAPNTQTTINRYFLAGYNTLCMPMTLSGEELAASAKDLRVEKLVGIGQEGDDLMLYFMDCTSEGIEAGVPYLVYSPTNQTMRARTAKAERVSPDLRDIRMSDDNGNVIRYCSSWESLAEFGRYGIPAQQDVTPLESVLIRTAGDKHFLPTRCGFVWESESGTANNLKIQHVKDWNEATAIKGISNGALVDVYDTNGVLLKRGVSSKDALNGMPCGVYVVGGLKVAK
mgnify:FL=1